MPEDTSGFRKVQATDLKPKKQAELRAALQRELTDALIRAIKAEPPPVDLASVKLILKPGQKISEWKAVADCGTCGTCNTCSTCQTCSTHVLPREIDPAVVRKLGVEVKIPQK